ncbi:MAG: ABC-type transport system involved in cytochrome c biogenesis permease subunit [Alphaproteobacteria bacterium]|jgi:ABC-type transport system involved in cytochrome c biogenesis permease subunit
MINLKNIFLKLVHFSSRTDVFFILLLWLMILLVAGTIAQKDIGLYAAQKQYFSSFFIMIGDIIPLPSGYTVMSLIFFGLLSKTMLEKWQRKNIGTLVTHLSILMLFLGSFLTANFSSEGNMVIEEGIESQYVSDYHKLEIAVIEIKNNGTEKVTAFNEDWLQAGKIITHKNLPFTAEILQYHRNALVEKYHKNILNEEHHVSSNSYRISSLPLLKENEMNQAAVILNVTTKKNSKTYTLFQDMPFKPIVKDGQNIFRIELRHKRTYLPFKIKLNKFKVDRYAGSDQAQNYSSEVVLMDGDLTWHSIISMNEPLRYKGYTFFQSSYIEGSRDTTVLAVVNNIGRLFPYISSSLLCLGLFIHLCVRIPRLIHKYSALILILFAFISPSAHANNIDISSSSFDTIPILENGRIKPLDTFARHWLTTFNGKDSLENMSASNWLAEALFDHQNAYQRLIFDISNPAVVLALELPKRPNHRYSFQEIIHATKTHLNTIKPLEKIEKNIRTLEQNQILTLYKNTVKYYKISQSFNLNEESKLLKIVPAQWGNSSNWHSPWDILNEGQGSPATAKLLQKWQNIALAYRQKNLENFTALSNFIYTQTLPLSNIKASPNKLVLEVISNKIKPFKTSIIFYVSSLVLLMISGLIYRKKLRVLSHAMLGLGCIIHTAGILVRMFIMSRPPVTTLYESVLFVSLIAVIFSLIFEYRKKDGIGIFIGSVIGIFLQFISLRYASEGDTLGMLDAVLNTNFWLATHVVTITIGYGCCLVAGLLGHIYLVTKSRKPHLKKTLDILTKNMLGATLVALFFSTLGTILGGIWADQSWGRFWGWDPKENGAMLICMWLIWLLHGRISGKLQPLYFAAGVAATNIMVALAWFGVNLLGVGLHSYGFTNNILLNLILFCTAEMLFILVLVVLNTYKTKDKEAKA